MVAARSTAAMPTPINSITSSARLVPARASRFVSRGDISRKTDRTRKRNVYITKDRSRVSEWNQLRMINVSKFAVLENKFMQNISTDRRCQINQKVHRRFTRVKGRLCAIVHGRVTSYVSPQ
ncbi:unnamed protein product [Trichogramma brassicae]|uniref:Uncharacterized protein n=1 Tax=Trichogramma brassicae TaxID=86971 RepID=A0A6H5J3G1_9HYME|nr:unnamed protein product [Trichogramma brassicae]